VEAEEDLVVAVMAEVEVGVGHIKMRQGRVVIMEVVVVAIQAVREHLELRV
jgi:hypothetical protein